MGTLYGNRVQASFNNAAAITTSDTAAVNPPTGAILVSGVAGNVKVDTVGGQTIVIPAIAGQVLPIAAKRVYATGTTATLLVALY